MTGNRGDALSIGRIDWWSVLIYLLLVAAGWVNIYSVLNEGADGGIFDLSQRYGKQLIWIGVCLFAAVAILLIDDKYYHIFAYPAYWISIAVLIAVLFVGSTINGAKAWITIGSVAIQPTEFVKFTTALALARYISRYNFSIHRLRDIAGAFALILLPVAIIIMQRDVGSAVVYAAFLFVLFREGLNGWIFVIIITAVLLFIFSLIFTSFTVLASLFLACVIGEGIVNGRWKSKAIYLSVVALAALAIYFGITLLTGKEVTLYFSLLAASLATLPLALIYPYRHRLRNAYAFIALFLGALVFSASVDFVFDNVVEVHQQKRILDVLGLEKDTQNWGYNANQSKIAIGSGGFFGKGFMEGTQTKYNFVPEQSTDFIFCTVGEEWGFLGSTLIVALFFVMIFRLLRMAERQHEAFGRVYCYSAAGIFLFHIIINIGMTIGLMPVIGIPLPFFSYGGSSLLAFTILFFVAVKLDATKRDI